MSGRPDRGVSDVLAFVLVFALIATTAGIVFVAGAGTLEQRQAAQRAENAERAWDLLAGNVGDVARGEAPTRSTEVRLSGAEAVVGDAATVTVRVNGTEELRATTRPIVYRGESTEIAYLAGGVLRTDRSGSRMLRDPRLLLGDRRTVLPVVTLESAGGTSVGGTTTAFVRTTLTDSSVVHERPATPSRVTLELRTTPDRARAWRAHLERELAWEDDPCAGSAVASGTVSCEFVTDRFYLTRSTIDVALSA
jgi:hypothetical protein